MSLGQLGVNIDDAYGLGPPKRYGEDKDREG